jgi:SHAQKYF class myb-like DNA-binding protein
MDGQQKRRFVWSPELHSRFEAAVNALGLDAAKPKSILRLMNVEGLTKANIKSHLQKYRCLMQKRASSSATTSQPSTAPVSASGEASLSRDTSPAETAMLAITMCGGALPGVQSCMPASTPSAASGSATCANIMDLSALSSSDQRQAALPDAIISQGGCSLQRNLEVQEMTLKVQMDLQEELSRQLQLQKRLQTEMECMMNARAAEAKAMDESSATSSKMNNIMALKHKLQHELQAHLRMQHQLLSQLNQVVLPVIGGDAMPGGAAPLGSAAAAAGEPSVQHDLGNDDGEEDGGEDDEDDEDDYEGEEEMGSAKRPKLDR